MHLKLLVALTFVVVCSTRHTGQGIFFVDVVDDDNIVITGNGKTKVEYAFRDNPNHQGQRYFHILMIGADFEVRGKAVVNGSRQGGPEGSHVDVLFQIFKQYSDQLDEQGFVELLKTLEKHAKNNEISGMFVHGLEFIYKENQNNLNDENFNYGRNQDYRRSYGTYNQQYPYQYVGRNYNSRHTGHPWNNNGRNYGPHADVYGSFYYQYPQ